MKKTLSLLMAIPLLAGMAFAGNGEPVPALQPVPETHTIHADANGKALYFNGNSEDPVVYSETQPVISENMPQCTQPTLYVTWYMTRWCNFFIVISTTTWPSPNYWHLTNITSTNSPQVLRYDLTPANPITMQVFPALYGTTYNVTITDFSPGQTLCPNGATFGIYPPAYCDRRPVRIDDWYNNPPGLPAARQALPEDPDEATEVPDLEVKWRLEELDPYTYEPVFTIDNPLCWENCNHAGASNWFNGFNAFDETTIAALQAGSSTACTTDPGTFDETKLYRVTRSTKVPTQEDWTDFAVLIEPVGSGGGEKTTAIEVPTEQTDLFEIARDQVAKTVTFTTAIDAGMLRIYDVAGNEVSRIVLEDETFEYRMDVSGLATGAFIVHLQKDAQVTTRKFVIE